MLLNLDIKFTHKNIKHVIFAVLLLTVSTSFHFFPIHATSPYESGYDHGCDDAGISDPGDRYINQPEKGPAYHTSEFMDGYYSGFSSCGGNDGENYEKSPQIQKNDQYYYHEPLQSERAQDTIIDDLGQIVDCSIKAAPLASAAGPVGTVLGGIGCGIYAGETDKQ